MKTILYALLTGSLISLLPLNVYAAPSALDGKEFKGEMTKQGDAKGDPDTLQFKDGKFVSTECVQYGFTEAPYTATKEGDVTKFSAQAKNNNGVTMTWSGTVKGDSIDSAAIWQQGEKKDNYTFKGTSKQ